MGDDGSKPVIGPAIPAHLLQAADPAPQNAAPPKRVMGPTLPPRQDEEEPKLSAAAQSFLEREKRMKEAADREAAGLAPLSEDQRSNRPDWMLAPPTAQSFTETLQKDHSSALKSRGFSQAQNARVQRGRGGVNGAGEDDMSLWTETPQEREKRLMEEEMGIRPKASDRQPVEDEQERLKKIADREREEQVQRAIREHNNQRGPSLLEQHQAKRRAEVKGKDSKRDKSDSSSSRRRRDVSESESSSEGRSRKHKRRDEDDRQGKRRSKRYSSQSDSGSDSEVERRQRKHKSRGRDEDKADRHRKHHHRHRSEFEERIRDKEREQRRRERRREREKEKDEEREKERERKKKKKRRDREREEKEEKTGAPMMVWDREAALSVGGKLMDTQKRMDTIRSASGLGSRFGSGSARFL